MESTLILGYGNVDREDDGVAWHVIVSLAARLGFKGPFYPEEGLPPSDRSPHFLFTLQLIPELAETIAGYKRVCFVDAHTGSTPEEVHISRLIGEFQTSPLTHHLTPQSCLALSHALYGGSTEAILVSVKGYEFGFSRQLSSKALSLVNKAVDQIFRWLQGSEIQYN